MNATARTGPAAQRPHADALVVVDFSGDLASKKNFLGWHDPAAGAPTPNRPTGRALQ